MALLINKIGNHEFIALLGTAVPPMQTVVAQSRPGVTGTEFTLTAPKGRPFALVSQVDVASYLEAWNKYTQYRQMIDADLFELIIGGVSSIAAGPYKVKVLDITPGRMMTIRGASGLTFDATSQGFCECRWELFSVPIT